MTLKGEGTLKCNHGGQRGDGRGREGEGGGGKF